MIYAGHLPASGDSFGCLDGAIVQRTPFSFVGDLSFRKICRPRPQPIRSSAAPVKFTTHLYTAIGGRGVREGKRAGTELWGKKNAATQVRPGYVGLRVAKKKATNVSNLEDEEGGGRLGPDTRRPVKGPFY